MQRSIRVDKNRQEIKQHGSVQFPFSVSYENILDYGKCRCVFHWHEALEIIYVESGYMDCQVNERFYRLREGDCLLINSGSMHRAWNADSQSCRFFALSFLPGLISDHGIIWYKYLKPLNSISAYLLAADSDEAWQQQCREQIMKAVKCDEKNSDTYEIDVIIHILNFIAVFYRSIKGKIELRYDSMQTAQIKEILAYIHQNYHHPLKLEQIAKDMQLSVSSCTHIFKRYLHESLFIYILRYRVKKSLSLLANSEYNITEIALRTGFNSASYYARVFRKYMDMSPNCYRKQICKSKL